MVNNILDTPIEYLKGVGPQRAELLKKEIKIFVFADLISYYPFRYVDRTIFNKINEIDANLNYVQLKGKLNRLEIIGTKRSKRLIGIFSDGSKQIELVWFQGIKWMMDTLKANTEYIVFGKPSSYKGKINIAHPEIDPVTEGVNPIASSLQPIYYSSERLKNAGLESKGICKLQKVLINLLRNKIDEILPDDLIYKLKLISREDAIKNIHLPESSERLQKAEFRLKFEELFFIQIKLLKLKLIRNQHHQGFFFSKIGNNFNEFYRNCLPFEQHQIDVVHR